MLFKDSDRDILFSILKSISNIKETQDAHTEMIRTLKERQISEANATDKLQATLERIIARLDLFIKEFESIKPLAVELKQLIQSLNTTKKR